MRHTLIRTDGSKITVERFVQLPKLKIGHWMISIGYKTWHEVVAPIQEDTGNIFGYPAREFLARQYK